jgi:ATP-dependent helicase/nuclease subunit B
MPAIASTVLAADWRPTELWPELARQTLAWLTQQAVPPRDAVVLLPFAALLAPARAAFATLGGWQPRVETPLTLAGTLGPPPTPEPGQCSGDASRDHLAATQLLRQQPWGQAWARRDPVGFLAITQAFVQAAQQLRDAASACPPAQRELFWNQAREALGPPPAVGALEALLLRVALEWASAAAPASTDGLFALRPAAWVVLKIGGADPIAQALLDSASCPALLLDADPRSEQPFAAVAASAQLQELRCNDFEAEAQATAQAVLQAVNRGATPVALVALDRELLRRVRALLEVAQLPLLDETGWKLATTAAAARVLALLHAATPGASRDNTLQWLKLRPAADAVALLSLEALWRRRRHVPDAAAAQALLARAQAHLRLLGAEPPRRSKPLLQWLSQLAQALHVDGSLQALRDDRAGQQVLQALGLWDQGDATWRANAEPVQMSFADFVAWVRQTLEEATYLPLPEPGAQVVITPLARAFGRRFAQVVMPATDQRHLGLAASGNTLISDSLAERLGLPGAAERRERQLLALAHALRADAVLLLRRLHEDKEPLAQSPAVRWLLLARQRSGQPVWPSAVWSPPLASRSAAPVQRPLPRVQGRLPALVSASQLEALRQCPYRFFARAVLRLDEAEELDAALAKRDYGNWLHHLLHHFHSQRVLGGDDLAQLNASAQAATAALSLDEGELLPFAASFERLAPAYLAWLHDRENRGWYWADGESDHRRTDAALGGTELRGRIDRLDHGPDDARQLIDYKTTAVAELRKRVKQPLEDTQLAFYAALLGGDAALNAIYLALDEDDAPREVPHPAVHNTAALLVAAVGEEWQRMQQGAALPALGEGKVCEGCEARGLCRRDQWVAA